MSALFPGSIWIYLVGALLLTGVGAYGGYQITAWAKDETISKLELASDAAKQAAQVDYQKKAASIASNNFSSGQKDQAAQDKLHPIYVNIIQKVPTYVTKTQEAKSCLTVGFIRLLAASSRAADPATLGLAVGQSDDDCSSLAESDVAGWFASFAEPSFANAQQLNDLIANVQSNDAAASAAPASK